MVRVDRKNWYIVRSIRMMSELIREGFDLLNVMDSDDNPHFKVFAFEDTPELQKSISQISRKMKQR